MGWISNYVSQRGIKSAVVSLSLSGASSQSLNAAIQSLVKVLVHWSSIRSSFVNAVLAAYELLTFMKILSIQLKSQLFCGSHLEEQH